MNTTTLNTLLRSALVVALFGVLAGTAAAQCTTAGVTTTCNLRAVARTATSAANSFSAPMWAFVADTGNCTNNPATAWAVGPMLQVDLATASNLTINLRNCLAEPVSLVIPGLPMPTGSAPSTATDLAGRTRATSFTSEALANGTVQYSWSGIKPGTYLYHSGSNPAKQVQMGLYGALIVDQDRTQPAGVPFVAYPDNPDTVAVDPVEYDIDAVIVFSEVDPALHTPPAAATPLGFKPKYFLVNGQANGSTSLTGLSLNQRVLLRYVNAGLNTYLPNLLGEDLEWVAEDGNPYTYRKTSYSGPLAAGKTLDALWTPVTPGAHKLYDRRLFLSSNGVAGGGLIATLTVTSPAGTPVAVAGPDQLHVPMYVAGTTTQTTVTLDGTGSYDTGNGSTRTNPALWTYSWSWVSRPAGSTAALSLESGVNNVNPTFTIDVPGTYALSLQVTDVARGSQTTALASAPDTVVVYTNLAPVAVISAPATANVYSTVALDASASHDPDGDPITYAWTVTAPDLTETLLSGMTTSFVPAQTGDYTVALVVSDFELDSAPASAIVSVAVAVNLPPAANQDYATVTWFQNPPATSVVIDVVANDTDTDGIAGIDPTSVTIVSQPTQAGTVINNGDGTVTYSPTSHWRGTDSFVYTVRDTFGLVSNPAIVLVNVVK